MSDRTFITLNHGWFYLGPVSAFTLQPKPLEINGTRLIAYRTQAGHLQVTQRHCPHMGADLANAQVQGEALRCPFHHWEFDPHGHCQHIPGLAPNLHKPSFAKLINYPTVERKQHVFCFIAANHLAHQQHPQFYEFPFFEELSWQECTLSRVRHIEGETSWFMAAANAFDISHFQSVHKRFCSSPPELSEPTAFAKKIILKYQILEKSKLARFLSFVFGQQAQLEFTVFSGNLILATTQIGHFKNRMLINVIPVGNHFKAYLFTVGTRSKNPLQILLREIQATFSARFFNQECREIKGALINFKRLGPFDRILREYFDWLIACHRPTQPALTVTLSAPGEAAHPKTSPETIIGNLPHHV